jgi:hypothetical protein
LFPFMLLSFSFACRIYLLLSCILIITHHRFNQIPHNVRGWNCRY